ncbi:hypothetical protein GBA52_003520 [Prunus armeniaca]|nr:hypothetical protein GBA52_003520 [Prunus armeniaca]
MKNQVGEDDERRIMFGIFRFRAIPNTFPQHQHPQPSYTKTSMNMLKLNLERFSGTYSYGWLASVKRFLEYYEIPKEDKIIVATVNFFRDASLWMCWFKQRYSKNYGLFCDMLLQHLGTTDSTDFEASFSYFQQSGSLEDYLHNFTKLACRAPDWSNF